MENEYDDGYDYYLYVYRSKIVRVVKTRKSYNVVSYKNVISYSKSQIPEGVNIDELLYNYNYSVTNGYEFVGVENEEILNPLKRMNLIIRLLEKLQLVVNYLKDSVISRAPDKDIYNRLLMQQIDNYQKDSSDIGSLLEAEFKCSKFENYETLIEAINLQYQDASEIFAYLRYKEFEVKKLLKENNFYEVENIINEMQLKLNI